MPPATPSAMPPCCQLSLDFCAGDEAAAALPPVLASSPAAAAEPLPEPLVFCHPQANRQLVLDGVRIDYALERRRRRNIGFTVDEQGLRVSAPRWVSLRDIDTAVGSKARWIVAKLREARLREQQLMAGRIVWGPGAQFPFLGEAVTVVLQAPASPASPRAALSVQAHAAGSRQVLQLALPQAPEPSQVRDAVQAWLMEQAQQLFTERLHHFADRLGVQWRRLVLSSARTRWGTAHADGTIRLNWRLIHFRQPVIDYVVAHEISHLRVMDHSPRFWDTVGTLVPTYAALRGELKREVLSGW